VSESKDIPTTEPYLLQLVLSLEAAAMQQMGKLQNPISGKTDRDLPMAKATIDMLSMLERKTAGNLSEEEEKLIKRSLYQLRMNYVDELKAEEKAGDTDESLAEDQPQSDGGDSGADADEKG